MLESRWRWVECGRMRARALTEYGETSRWWKGVKAVIEPSALSLGCVVQEMMTNRVISEEIGSGPMGRNPNSISRLMLGRCGPRTPMMQKVSRPILGQPIASFRRNACNHSPADPRSTLRQISMADLHRVFQSPFIGSTTQTWAVRESRNTTG